MIETNSWESFKNFLNRPISRGKAMLQISCFITVMFALLDLAFYYKFGVFMCTSDEFRGLFVGEAVILFYCWVNYLLFRNER